MNHGYTYQSALAASEGIKWRIEDIIGDDKRLDFMKPLCRSLWRGWSSYPS